MEVRTTRTLPEAQDQEEEQPEEQLQQVFLERRRKRPLTEPL